MYIHKVIIGDSTNTCKFCFSNNSHGLHQCNPHWNELHNAVYLLTDVKLIQDVHTDTVYSTHALLLYSINAELSNLSN